MNTTQYLGRLIAAIVGVSVPIVTMALALPGLAQEKSHKTQERIGVYDSRAVAVAYAGSTFQETKMKDLTAQSKKAREAGGVTEVSRLEVEGQAWQAKLKKQGFGTASVDDLLAHISGELPKIQESAGVTRLISKWNKAELDKHPKAAQVDVTLRLVDAFHPTEIQRKRAIEIQKIRPAKL
jgi:hypothetical protein